MWASGSVSSSNHYPEINHSLLLGLIDSCLHTDNSNDHKSQLTCVVKGKLSILLARIAGDD